MRKLKEYKPTDFMAEGSAYDKDAADYAVSFIECLCHTKGTWAGKPFELIDWQERIVRIVRDSVFRSPKGKAGNRQFNSRIYRDTKGRWGRQARSLIAKFPLRMGFVNMGNIA